mmetsp:Transcript_25489/g.55154  ORF Transcript_25489/g.55154 Transcript_25489/m.55154 type:complete len:390 (+) Transcript_25489:223-1392(+)
MYTSHWSRSDTLDQGRGRHRYVIYSHFRSITHKMGRLRRSRCLFVRAMLLIVLVCKFSIMMSGVIAPPSDPTDRAVSLEYYSYTSSLPRNGSMFSPGTLPLSRLETFQRCYVDPKRYQKHLALNGKRCSISEKYKLAYVMVAKSGSSTSRVVMKNGFDGKEKGKCTKELESHAKPGKDNMFYFSFFRDPTSRFFSCYQEMFVKWFKLRRRRQVPEKYQRFLEPYHGMDIRDYIELFFSGEGAALLTRTLEQFVDDYDAEDPFDHHLRLQIPRFLDLTTGRTYTMDAVLDTHNMDEQFQEIADMVNASRPEVLHAYERGETRLNTSGVSVKARHKICQLSAIDFCCLNYPLPPECRDTGDLNADAVQCRWISKPELTNDLLIEAVSPFPP